MKNSKSSRQQQQYASERKNGKRSEKKSSKLDRKSSRGMIYENEELRLRTININAEVERGQSDIKRLRRENEHLRREIWTLRDECDRLNKRFKAKLGDHDYGGCRGSGGSGGSCNNRRCSARDSGGCEGNSDDSDSCDTCRGDDGHCSDDCCQEGGSGGCVPVKPPLQNAGNIEGATAPPTPPQVPNAGGQNVHFDHLSVVSEETLSNSEMPAQHNDHLLVYTHDPNGSQSTLPSLVGPLTPLTPIELVANQLNDLQAMVPPLSYFENILQQHMTGNTPESGNTSSTGTGQTVRQTNGWDYNLQSPFTQRKYSNNSSPARSPGIQQPQQHQQLTTFVPTHTMQVTTPPKNEMNATQQMPGGITDASSIETVAITTNAAQSLQSSPKHFFAPIKPRLKLNTTLANRNLPTVAVAPPTRPGSCNTLDTTAATAATAMQQNFEPPDIFVNNALASPYQRQLPPCGGQQQQQQQQQQQAQRLHSPQVSPRHRRCQQQQQQQQQHHLQHKHHQQLQHQCQQHQRQCQQQQQQQHHYHNIQHQQQQLQQHCELHKTVVNVAATVGLGFGGVGSVVDLYSAALASAASMAAADKRSSLSTSAPALVPLPQPQPQFQLMQLPPAPVAVSVPVLSQFLVEHSNQIYTKPAEPIYATAQKRCSNTCISATALTKPLMTATTNTTKTTIATPTTNKNCATNSPTPATSITTTTIPITTTPTTITKSTTTQTTNIVYDGTKATNKFVGQNQTDSVNLEAILNDIESISTDILAIQLEKNRSRDNLTSTKNAAKSEMSADDKSKKPYRSEMNLYLNYDGTNPTITPTTTPTFAVQAATPVTNAGAMITATNGKSKNNNCLPHEREHTESPSPHIPDPMAPFPEKCRYIGFDQLNQVATAQLRPPLPPAQVVATVAGPKTVLTPPKVPPPLPPARIFPPTTNAHGEHAGTAPGAPVTSPMHTVTPNKSSLYKAIASATAKRAIFRSAPTHLTRSLDVDYTQADAAEREALMSTDSKSDELGDAANRCARRVSIVCAEEFNAGQMPHGSQAQNIIDASAVPTTTVSCVDLPASLALPNPQIKCFKQTSQSTPSSPHSLRRQTAISEAPQPNLMHHTHQQHSNTALHHRKDSCDPSMAPQPQPQPQPMTATVSRTKCSRRHSEGTVHSVHRNSGTSGGVGSGGHHHHHSHHNHQHSSSLISNNPHHSHHSHQDSNHETIASFSDRNSNSFASSRESSTSFSVRSNRRKISISSHTGGKIPWCGCWGNGCC